MAVKNRVALVTGGAKGIGRAITRQLAATGYDVVVTGRDSAALDAEVAHLADTGFTGHARVMNVRDPASVDKVFTEVFDSIGPPDVLVNCAGIIVRADATDYTDDDWLSVIETDLNGVFWCCRAGARSMLAHGGGGAIVNIGSVVASVGYPGRASYAASKAGMEGLVRTLAVEWATRGIRVNGIAPGWTLTEMVQAGFDSGKLDRAALEGRIPMRRLARPDEIAAVVLFLISDAASYLTGQILTVDGGFTINGDV